MLFVTHSALGDNDVYKRVYYWFNAFAFTLLPLLLLAVFNCFLINAVRQSRKARRSMTQVGTERRTAYDSTRLNGGAAQCFWAERLRTVR